MIRAALAGLSGTLAPLGLAVLVAGACHALEGRISPAQAGEGLLILGSLWATFALIFYLTARLGTWDFWG